MRQNTPKPNKGQNEYKPKTSTSFIELIAVLMLIAGVIIIVLAFTNNNSTSGISAIYGVSCIVVAALLFIIAGLADDVHLLTYLIQNDAGKYQSFMLSHIRDMEKELTGIKNGVAALSGKMEEK